MTALASVPTIDQQEVATRIITECAFNPGLSVEEVAQRLSYPVPLVQEWLDNPATKVAIETKQQVLRESGYTFKAKCQIVAEQLVDELFKEATSADNELKDKNKTFELLAEYGGYKPSPQQVPVQPGTGWGLRIEFSQPDGKTASLTVGSIGIAPPSPQPLTLEAEVGAPPALVVNQDLDYS